MLRSLLPAAFLITVCAVSRADTLQYSFSQTYPNSPTHTFSFQVASQPITQDLIVNPGQNFFAVQNATATVDGAIAPYLVVFTFNNGAGGGGLVLAGPYYHQSDLTLSYSNAGGLPLYSGDPNSPTLLTGTFSLREIGAPYGGALGTLTVTNLTAATPEPSSLFLLGTGMAGMVGVARRRLT